MPAADTEGETTREKSLDDPRYRHLLAVTRSIAAEGYDAVSMRAVARDAQMSLTTIYQYVSSKDELIAEAHAGAMRRFSEAVVNRPPEGASPEERVREVMGRLAAGLASDEERTRTLMRSIYSSDVAVAAGRGSASESFRAALRAAIGDDCPSSVDSIVDTLGLTFHGALMAWLGGKYDGAQVQRLLDNAVTLVFRGAGPPAP